VALAPTGSLCRVRRQPITFSCRLTSRTAACSIGWPCRETDDRGQVTSAKWLPRQMKGIARDCACHPFQPRPLSRVERRMRGNKSSAYASNLWVLIMMFPSRKKFSVPRNVAVLWCLGRGQETKREILKNDIIMKQTLISNRFFAGRRGRIGLVRCFQPRTGCGRHRHTDLCGGGRRCFLIIP